MSTGHRPHEGGRDERVSLAGPDPEVVLRALLRVNPNDEPVE